MAPLLSFSYLAASNSQLRAVPWAGGLLAASRVACAAVVVLVAFARWRERKGAGGWMLAAGTAILTVVTSRRWRRPSSGLLSLVS